MEKQKSAAQLTVERIVGEQEAQRLIQNLAMGHKVTVMIGKAGHKSRHELSYAFPFVYTTDPRVRLVEARGGGKWADQAEFLWTALAALLIDDPYATAGKANCISLWVGGTVASSRLRLKGHIGPRAYVKPT